LYRCFALQVATRPVLRFLSHARKAGNRDQRDGKEKNRSGYKLQVTEAQVFQQ
jgi:hypothetical protein